MYTYIYTENTHMDMYRVGKVVDLTANTRKNFDSSAEKHKAVLFNNAGNVINYSVVFHDSATTSPGGITLTCGTTGGYGPLILPCVVKAITPTANSRIVLLS
jgi:hypothetical protein